ncbi:hypothetical protein [Acinetobacter sp.]|uniref:hypothetical protein n=1 Tax=Acinetobacter sp. TaxID=472 RepID=UPI0025C5DC8C|nr:hypothetical protein [Acinetobacter sp.]
MQKVKIGSLKDGSKFKVSNRKSGATYKVITKAKGYVVFTSTRSEKSFAEKAGKLVYPK